MAPSRQHASAFLDGAGCERIEALRQRWDPDMAAQIGAHLTLVYPEEIADPALLVEAAVRAARTTPPFRIAVGSAFHVGGPSDGVFFEVHDVDRGIERFRQVAVPALKAVDFPRHVTVVHPRTSKCGKEAWAALSSLKLELEFTVASVAITGFDGVAWRTLLVVPLSDWAPAPNDRHR